jgi:uroporphyrinogen-III synthase
VLVEGLNAAGWVVDVVEAYRTVPVAAGGGSGLGDTVRSADAVCFTSSSTVTGFVSAVGLAAAPPVVVCIGPVTAATATDAGFHVDAVAEVSTVDGLVDALIRVIGSPTPP